MNKIGRPEPRVLILGATGMLGHKLAEVCAVRFTTWASVRTDERRATSLRTLDPSRTISGVDALKFETVVEAFSEAQPDVVVNCIGIVKQLPEGNDPIPCITVNALFPHRLAQQTQACGARLIHLSTDCVFSGRQGLYKETDPPDAEDLYGRSKLLGEVTGPGCLTLRTSMIGRQWGAPTGLLEWFLSRRGEHLKGYRHAIFSGLTTRVLAHLIAEVIERHPGLEGLYHVASQAISKLDLLRLLEQEYRIGATIEPDDTVRVDRRLDGSRFRQATGFEAPSWPSMIREMAQEEPA